MTLSFYKYIFSQLQLYKLRVYGEYQIAVIAPVLHVT